MRGNEFCRVVKHYAAAKGVIPDALELAEQSRAPSRVVDVLKTQVSAASITLGSPSAWGDQLVGYRQLVNGFYEVLRGRSAFFTMLQSGALSRVPLKVRFNAATSAAGGSIVGPGQAIPLSQVNFATDTLEPAKAAALIVVTEELLRSAAPGGEAAFGRELRNAVSDVVDQHFFDLIGQAVTAQFATAGPMADILLDLVNTTDSSSLYFVMTPGLANVMSTVLGGPGAGRLFPEMTPQGGSIVGVPALVSTQVPAAAGSPTQNSLWLVDASGIVANADTIEVSMSRQSLVEMANPAAQDATGPTAATGPLVSLWQSNSVGIKATCWFGASVVRSNAVAVLQGVSW
jgi:HK97 family phage major capsid protein